MRSVLFRTGGAAGLFLVVNFAAGLALDATRTRCGGRESGCVNNARRAGAEVIILGSSRAKHHYDDSMLSRLWGAKVFNAGYDGQGIPFSRGMLDLIARKCAPKLVILDVVVFGDDFDRAHALDPWYFESPVLRSLPASGERRAPGAYGEDWRTSALMRIPLYRYSGKVKHTLKDAYIAFSDTGYEAIPVKVGTPSATMSESGALQCDWLDGELGAIRRQCEAMGARLVLVVSPRRSDFGRDVAVEPANAFAKAHGVPLFIYDGGTHPEFSSEKLFADVSHLHAEGAELFTKSLAGDIRPLLPFTPRAAISAGAATAPAR